MHYFDTKVIPGARKKFSLLLWGAIIQGNTVQYILANPNSPVPLRKNIVRISEFVRIIEIALFSIDNKQH